MSVPRTTGRAWGCEWVPRWAWNRGMGCRPFQAWSWTWPYCGSSVDHCSVGMAPGPWVVADDPGAMPTRSPRRRLRRRIGREAAPSAQAHQQADPCVGQGQAELDGVVAGSEADDGQGSVQRPIWRVAQPGADLLSGHLVGVLPR